MKIMSRLLISGLFGLFLMNGMNGMDAAAKTAAPKPKTFVSVGTQTDELQANEVQTNVGDAVSTMPVPVQSAAEIFAQHRAKYPSRYKIQQPRIRQQRRGYRARPCRRMLRHSQYKRKNVGYRRSCYTRLMAYKARQRAYRMQRLQKMAQKRSHPRRMQRQLVPQLPVVGTHDISVQSEPVVPSASLSVLLPEPTVQPTLAEELPALPVKVDEPAAVVAQEKEQEQPQTEPQPNLMPEQTQPQSPEKSAVSDSASVLSTVSKSAYPASVAQAHDMLLPEAEQKKIIAQQIAQQLEAQKKRAVVEQPHVPQVAQEQGAAVQGLTPQEEITKNLVLTLLFAPQVEQEKLLKLLSEQERKMLGNYAAAVKELVPLSPEQRQLKLEKLPATPQKVVKAILVDLDALQKEQAAVVNGQQPSTVKQAAIGIGKILATAWVLDKVKDGLKAQLKKTSYGRQLKFLIDPAVSLAQIFGPLLFTHTAFGQKLMNGVARLLPASLQPSVSDSAMPEDAPLSLMPPAPAVSQPQASATVPAH